MSIILPGQEELEKYGSQPVITPAQAKNQPFVPGSDVTIDHAWNETHDLDTTHESIQRMLAGGTPNWVKWPRDYISFMRESFKEEKEKSDKMGVGYRWSDQAMLTDKSARRINGIMTRDFLHKLHSNGVQAVCFPSEWKNYGGGPTVGLWCVPPGRGKLRYVCYLDVPMMFEWSILHLDEHGLPHGEESRGWRTVAVQLVEKEIITEKQCHQIFGAPPGNEISARYYRSLWEKRHSRPYQDEEERGLEG